MTSVCPASSTEDVINEALHAIETVLDSDSRREDSIDPQDVLHYVTVPGVMDRMTADTALKVLDRFGVKFLCNFSLYHGACAVLQLIEVVASCKLAVIGAVITAACMVVKMSLVLHRVLASADPFMLDASERAEFSRLAEHTLRLLESKYGFWCDKFGLRATWDAWVAVAGVTAASVTAAGLLE
jgi:hypothetical protein